MKYTLVFILAAVSILGIFAMMQPYSTGHAALEDIEGANYTLLAKVQEPCFCAKGEDVAQQIQEQQIAYLSIVGSAEGGMLRKEISEETAIKVLNNYAEGTCKKCMGG